MVSEVYINWPGLVIVLCAFAMVGLGLPLYESITGIVLGKGVRLARADNPRKYWTILTLHWISGISANAFIWAIVVLACLRRYWAV
ncbi:MAG TPA: hypothetical protein VM008_17570 [Phycisphaerae bacterium]|nr:hypothetical protein [Phycisphaerae bacterium]